MKRRSLNYFLAWLLGAALCALDGAAARAQPISNSPVSVGTRVEMFVDSWLIDSNRSRGVSLKLQTPVRREVVLTTDKPWEGKDSAYFTVFQEGERIRLYYRGFIPEGGDASDKQVTCYAESRDGIHFTRPNLGLYEFQGSKGKQHCPSGGGISQLRPFLDTNPKSKPGERYKAVGGVENRLFAFSSPDGIRWKKIQAEPVMTRGAFDSLNLVFWDEQTKFYRCYSRDWTGGGYSGFRAVRSNTSEDFLHWNDPVPNRYRTADGSAPPSEHFYTSATTPCPGAPHHYLAFPMRFLPDRKTPSRLKEAGVSDAVFLSSRDGVNWDRTFLEAWIRPGPDERNWTHRNNMPARGIVQTGASEFSMYLSEHFSWPDNRIRRVTIRRHGFGSVHTGHAGGEFTTRPLVFTGKNLLLNYATSAAGALQVEVQDAQGKPLPGFSLSDMELMFGDELDGVVKWKSGRDLSSVIGKPVRLRFVLKDADLFALRFQ